MNLGNFELDVWLPDGESTTQTTTTAADVPAGTEDVTPDWAAIRVELGVSSQTKAQNVAGFLLARILGGLMYGPR